MLPPDQQKTKNDAHGISRIAFQYVSQIALFWRVVFYYCFGLRQLPVDVTWTGTGSQFIKSR